VLKKELHGGKLEEKGSSRGRKVASVELERDEGRVPPVWSLEGKEGGRKAHEGGRLPPALDPLSEERWSRLAPQTHMCLKREGVQICITSLLHCNVPSGLHTLLDLYAFVPLPIVYYLNPKINVIL
jgi:hypothetical protein